MDRTHRTGLPGVVALVLAGCSTTPSAKEVWFDTAVEPELVREIRLSTLLPVMWSEDFAKRNDVAGWRELMDEMTAKRDAVWQELIFDALVNGWQDMHFELQRNAELTRTNFDAWKRDPHGSHASVMEKWKKIQRDPQAFRRTIREAVEGGRR
jgi:hypothetical protein